MTIYLFFWFVVSSWGTPGGESGNPLQYSCLENPMDRRAWRATVHGVAKSRIWLKQLSMHTQMKHVLSKLFHLSDLLQTPNDGRMVNTEFFSNFSCRWKRISFNDYSQLFIVEFWWPATPFLIFKALVSSAKLLEPPWHCTFMPKESNFSYGSWFPLEHFKRKQKHTKLWSF